MDQTSLLLPETKDMLATGRTEELKDALREMHPADIAAILVKLEDKERVTVFRLLAKEKALEVFEELKEEEQATLLSGLTKERATEVLDEMAPDDRADLFEELPEEIAARFLPLMREEERKNVEKLLAYEENTAGAIMTTKYASLSKTISVGEALDIIRKTAPKRETVYYSYIIEGNGALIGVVSIKDLVLAQPTERIESLMRTNVISVKVEEDQEEVARAFEKYEFLALPVVDKNNALLGIVTVDDIVGIIKEEATEDMHKMAAMQAPEEEYFKAGVFTRARKRIIWLIALLVVYTVSANILKGYSAALEAMIALAFFIPMLTGTGGNTATQSATLVIRGLATGEVKVEDLFRIIRKEIGLGLVLGLTLGSILGIFGIVIAKSPRLGITVGTALAITITWATVSGAFLPLLLRRLKLDPAVAAGPFITTLIDISALFIYFEIAKRLLPI